MGTKDFEAINFKPWVHIKHPIAIDTKYIPIVRTHKSQTTQWYAEKPKLRTIQFYDPGEVDIQAERLPPKFKPPITLQEDKPQI